MTKQGYIKCHVTFKYNGHESVHRFEVHGDRTFAEFMCLVRARLELGTTQLKPEDALFAFVNHSELVVGSRLMKEVAQQHKKQDDILYLTLMQEATFG